MKKNIEQLETLLLKELSTGLSEDWLQPPDDFAQQVLLRIADQQPATKSSLFSPYQLPSWMQWVALIGGFLLGAQQLISFMFGVWFVTTAAS